MYQVRGVHTVVYTETLGTPMREAIRPSVGAQSGLLIDGPYSRRSPTARAN